AGDVNFLQLVGIEPLGALDLRDDLVAAALDAEAVDEIAADGRGQIRADLLQVEAHAGDLVAVEHDLRLRLVDLGVDIEKHELAAGHGAALQLAGKLQDAIVRSGRGQHKLDRKRAAAGQRGRQHRKHREAGDGAELLLHFGRSEEHTSELQSREN